MNPTAHDIADLESGPICVGVDSNNDREDGPLRRTTSINDVEIALSRGLSQVQNVLQDVERSARFGLGVVATGLRLAEIIPTIDNQSTATESRLNTPYVDSVIDESKVRPERIQKEFREDLRDSLDYSPTGLRHYDLQTSDSLVFVNDESDDRINQLSFMTYNAGLLQYGILGLNIFQVY